MARRQELADQIAVGAVDLHAGKTGLLGERGGLAEAAHQVFDFRHGERARHMEEALQVGVGERHRRGRHGLAVERRRRLLAGVVDLHPQVGAVLAAGPRPGLEPVHVAAVFQHHVAGLAQGAPVDHHVAGHRQAGATPGPGPVEAGEAGGDPVVGGAEGLAHGGLAQPVLQRRAAGQLKGLVQRHGHGVSLHRAMGMCT